MEIILTLTKCCSSKKNKIQINGQVIKKLSVVMCCAGNSNLAETVCWGGDLKEGKTLDAVARKVSLRGVTFEWKHGS